MKQIHIDPNYNIPNKRRVDFFKDNLKLSASFGYRYALLGGGIQVFYKIADRTKRTSKKQ